MAEVPEAPQPSRGPMAAFLRVYEPAEVLASGSARAPAPSSTADAGARELAARERLAALRAASAVPPRVVSDLDLGHAHAGRGPASYYLMPAWSDGVPRLCPADLTKRALLAVEELRSVMPAELLYALLPPALVAEARSQLTRQGAGELVPHVRSSGWHVPLAWFSIFRPDQRVIDAGSGAGAPPTSLSGDRDVSPGEAEIRHDESACPAPALRATPVSVRYHAAMADARRCIARAIVAGRTVPGDLLAIADLEDIGRWLEEFHARSVVELDYGALTAMLGDAHDPQLPDGDCVGLVASAIADLRAGGRDRGIERLSSVRARWAALRAIGRAS
jgi:hypothetical protein